MEPLYGTHEQVRISCEGREEDVDAEIAPLVLALWQAGVDVLCSCQELEPGLACLQFADVADATKFLDLVGEFPGLDEEFLDTLYARVSGRSAEGNWLFNAFPKDRSVAEGPVEGDHIVIQNGPPNFHLRVAVRFPTDDIAGALERIKRRLLPACVRENNKPPAPS
jgi:hypothetical protein